ncbi:MAG: hypothetical protein WD025_04845 [Bacteriovoracaceae bacterium]
MEKGFNDDELADIMDEIESLEKEFSDDGDKKQTETVETQPVADHQEEDEAQKQDDQPHLKEAASSAPSHEHKKQDHVDDKMEDVLDELAHMPIEDVAPVSKVHSQNDSNVDSKVDAKVDAKVESDDEERDENIHHLQERSTVSENTHAKNETAMSFHVEGDMKFELSFHISGKFVGLTVTEEGLEIGLDGGAKFTVPLERSTADKKAS